MHTRTSADSAAEEHKYACRVFLGVLTTSHQFLIRPFGNFVSSVESGQQKPHDGHNPGHLFMCNIFNKYKWHEVYFHLHDSKFRSSF